MKDERVQNAAIPLNDSASGLMSLFKQVILRSGQGTISHSMQISYLRHYTYLKDLLDIVAELHG